MSLSDNFPLLLFIRLLAGVASAGVMIYGTLYVFSLHNNALLLPGFYGGVGLGIFLSNESSAYMQGWDLNADQMWSGLAVFSLGLTLLALLMRQQPAAHEPPSSTPSAPLDTRQIDWKWLLLINGLAGYGYIISATYLPLIVAHNVPHPWLQNHIWSLVGLSVIPSCFVWKRFALSYGYNRALICNLMFQALGVALATVANSPLACVASGIILGATFMGFVTTIMPMARQTAHPQGMNIIAFMTLSYGCGQIFGPIAVALFKTFEFSLNYAVLSAFLCLGVSILLCIKDKALSKEAV